MKQIWKFPLQMLGYQLITIPTDSKILTVQLQNKEPYLWAIVDFDSPMTSMTVWTYGTGHELDDNTGDYIGTYQYSTLVWHVFVKG